MAKIILYKTFYQGQSEFIGRNDDYLLCLLHFILTFCLTNPIYFIFVLTANDIINILHQ